VFPGGYGTFDELFEILTLQQTRKAPPMPVVLIGEEYWRSVVNFDALVEHDMIDRAELDLFAFADDAEGAWAAMVRRGLMAHSSNPSYPPPMTSCIALIVAAGRGTRLGAPLPKQYLPLGGVAVLRHSVLALRRHAAVSGVRVVIHPSDRAL